MKNISRVKLLRFVSFEIKVFSHFNDKNLPTYFSKYFNICTKLMATFLTFDLFLVMFHDFVPTSQIFFFRSLNLFSKYSDFIFLCYIFQMYFDLMCYFFWCSVIVNVFVTVLDVSCSVVSKWTEAFTRRELLGSPAGRGCDWLSSIMFLIYSA